VELAGTGATAGSTFSYSYTWTADVTVFVTISKPGFKWIRLDGVTLTAASQTVPVFQQTDLAYFNPA
jgi:hypothetical protein